MERLEGGKGERGEEGEGGGKRERGGGRGEERMKCNIRTQFPGWFQEGIARNRVEIRIGDTYITKYSCKG